MLKSETLLRKIKAIACHIICADWVEGFSTHVTEQA